MKKTARGFGVYTEFTDTYKNKIEVTQSSAACYDRVWVHIMGAGDPWLKGEASAHLSKQQAKWLIKGIQKWLDHVS